MNSALQQYRFAAVSSPLGADALLFHRMSGSERLGRLFEYELTVLSKDFNVELDKLLGEKVVVRLDAFDGRTRYFNGIVSAASREAPVRNYASYHLVLRPWLWLLTRTADCRIFQDKSAADIVKDIFRDHGFSDFEDQLSATYKSRDYCVQYRETDFNFVSRLMEEEGIYYYFKHNATQHMLVLSDSYSSHEPQPGYETVPYYPPDVHDRRERDHISVWSSTRTLQAGSYALNDFDFKAPRKNLQASTAMNRPHAYASYELYDYPGDYLESPDGNDYSRIRLEEVHAEHATLRGEGNVRGLNAGVLFKLSNHPLDQGEYLVLSSAFSIEAEQYETTGGGGSHLIFHCSLSAVQSSVPFRSARITPKPIIQGPQTAIVVTDKEGEEIWTDEYGRVKCQFHWDRERQGSCWIRTSQIWAGKEWGGIHIPRVGQEVIVEFLEGDPDKPIITGRVYNGTNMPPYPLPENMTQSGIKSRSSKGGTQKHFNEIRFEDKKDKEEVYVHAERVLTTVVEASESRSIGTGRETTVHKKNDDLKIKEGDRNVDILKGNDVLFVQTGDVEQQVPSGTYRVDAMEIQLTGFTKVKLVCGASSIEMTPGMITIKGPLVKIN